MFSPEPNKIIKLQKTPLIEDDFEKTAIIQNETFEQTPMEQQQITET